MRRAKVHEAKKKMTDLSPEQYRVCWKKGTERPFTGLYWNFNEPGIYQCICCGTDLFDSTEKYDSGTGWPSFLKPIGDAISEHVDDSLNVQRIEVSCARCGAHLGHVFRDGPPPLGLRYCINSVALNLKEKEHKERHYDKKKRL